GSGDEVRRPEVGDIVNVGAIAQFLALVSEAQSERDLQSVRRREIDIAEAGIALRRQTRDLADPLQDPVRDAAEGSGAEAGGTESHTRIEILAEVVQPGQPAQTLLGRSQANLLGELPWAAVIVTAQQIHRTAIGILMDTRRIALVCRHGGQGKR